MLRVRRIGAPLRSALCNATSCGHVRLLAIGGLFALSPRNSHPFFGDIKKIGASWGACPKALRPSRAFPFGFQVEITISGHRGTTGASRVTSGYNGRVPNRSPRIAPTTQAPRRGFPNSVRLRAVTCELPNVCETFAADRTSLHLRPEIREAFPRRNLRTAILGEQFGALPLFSRCHLATSRLVNMQSVGCRGCRGCFSVVRSLWAAA